jgi:hypothetical protein
LNNEAYEDTHDARGAYQAVNVITVGDDSFYAFDDGRPRSYGEWIDRLFYKYNNENLLPGAPGLGCIEQVRGDAGGSKFLRVADIWQMIFPYRRDH